MKKSFVFSLITVTLVVGLCSCMKVTKIIPWRGAEVISANGGTIVWMPMKDNVHLFPTIEIATLVLYDSDGEIVSDTLLDIESQKIQEEGYEITGEWYEVVASMNAVSITFSSNDTPFKREVNIFMQDGQGYGWREIHTSQSPKSWNQEKRSCN